MRRGRKRDTEGNQRGAALVEFAFVLPVLLILLFGIVEFAVAFNRAQAVEASAREGGRLAAISTTSTGDVTTRVNDALAGISLDGAVSVSVNPGGQPCFGRQGEQVTVTVSTPHDVNIPLFGNQTITLSSQATFRCEA